MTAKPAVPPKPKTLTASEKRQLVAALPAPISQSSGAASKEVPCVISSPFAASVASNPQFFYGPPTSSGFRSYLKETQSSKEISSNGGKPRRTSLPDAVVNAVAPPKNVASRVKIKTSDSSLFTSYSTSAVKPMERVQVGLECGSAFAEAKRKFTTGHASKNSNPYLPVHLTPASSSDKERRRASHDFVDSLPEHYDSEAGEKSDLNFYDMPDRSINRQPIPTAVPPEFFMGVTEDSIATEANVRNSVISNGTVCSTDSEKSSRLHNSDAENNHRGVPTAEKVAAEIVSSEKQYLRILRLLLVDFPNAVQGSVPVDEVNQLLKGLPEIEKLSEDLYEDLRVHFDVYPTERLISPVFLKKGKVLLLYVTYVNDFEKLIDTYRNLLRKYPRFAELVTAFENSSVCKKIPLVEYFHRPIQRLPQYPLLLGTYLRALEEDHPDRENTKRALDLVSNVTTQTNTSLASLEKVQKLLWYQARTVGYTFLRSNRVFIREGILKKLSRKAPQDRTILLCSDAIICGEFDSIAGMKFTVNAEYPLADIKVEPLMDSDYFDRDLEFGVYSTKKSFVFQAESVEERNAWLSAISRALEDKLKQKNALPALRRAHTSESAPSFAPIWIPDYRVKACQLCKKYFSRVFRRYHHCRLCGYAVCSDCSPHEIEIDYKDNRSKRVCVECFHDPSKNPHLYVSMLPRASVS